MKKIRINIDITIDDEEKKVYRIPECSIKRAAGSDFDLDKVIEDSLNKDETIKSIMNKVAIIDKLKEILL